MSVIAMGDRNGVAIGQSAHTGLLAEAGCMQAGQAMVYGKAPPRGRLWEGCYIDDHTICFKLPRDRLHCHSGHDCPACRADGGLLEDVQRFAQWSRRVHAGESA